MAVYTDGTHLIAYSLEELHAFANTDGHAGMNPARPMKGEGNGGLLYLRERN